MVKFWVRDASRANGSSLPAWHASCMPAWGKTSDKKQETGREPVFPLPKVEKKKKKKVEKGWIPQRAESWTNDSSHIPHGFEAWSFQRCLTALEEDVPPNFNWHLIYLRSFKTLPFTIRHQPKASLLFWNMRCLRVDSSLAVNHIHQALENASPVRRPSTVPCTEFHHPKFLSSWNQLTLFFSH